MMIFFLLIFVFLSSLLFALYFYRVFASVSEREQLQKEFLSFFKPRRRGAQRDDEEGVKNG